MTKIGRAVVLGAVATAAFPAHAQSLDLRPEVALEGRLFPEEPRFDDQLETAQGSLILSGEARWRSQDRSTQVRVEPYLRLDSADDDRTYADLREASLSYRAGDFDLTAGVSQVFWGVAEAHNPVDIINQADTLEDIDGDEKLGQPMIRLSWRGDFGTVEGFYLPFFRERAFPGREGRLRSDPIVDEDAVHYERSDEELAGDVALRYTTRLDDFDLGLHAFYGTSREPTLTFDPASGTLQPTYAELAQGGLDLQYTSGPWLLKVEGVAGEVSGERFTAAVAGFEYTFFDIGGQGFDLGVIGEYLHDDRDGTETPTPLFDNDVFVGTRLTLNDIQDTELLAGVIVDTETEAVQASAEFQRRLGDRTLLEVEGRAFAGGDDPLVDPLEADSVLTLRLTRFF
ncbi:MAG: hypothetical protein AAGK98_00240 [Pseudomonadota bacterium]